MGEGQRDPEQDSREAKQKKVVEVVSISLGESSAKHNDVFYVDNSTPSKRLHKKLKEGASSHVMAVTTILRAMVKRLEE